MRPTPAAFVGLYNSADTVEQVANRLAFWRMDEALAADNLADATANAKTLTVTSAPPVAGSLFDGASTGGRSFDGAADYASRAGDADSRGVFLGAAYTIECLIKPNTPGAIGTIYEYAGAAEGVETAEANTLFALDLAADLTLRTRWESGLGADQTVAIAATLTDQVVNYVAVVVDDDPDNAGQKRATFWIGKPPTSSSAPLTKSVVVTNLTPAATSGVFSQSHYLGAAQSVTVGAVDQYLKATLDDVRISRYALSDAAVRDSYARCFRPWSVETLLADGPSATRKRVLVADGDGTMQDLSALYGWNFVRAASTDDDIDQPTAAATVQIAREAYDGKLGQLVEGSLLNKNAAGSYDPMLQLRRRITVEEANVPEGWEIQGWEWQPIFDGYIDEISWASNPIEVRARDLRVPLFDQFILTTTDYTTGFPKDVEDHLQDLVDDNAPPTYGYVGGTPSIYVPASPSWALNLPCVQDPATVSDALDDLAQQIGWDCRYRWDIHRCEYRLTFFEPPRSVTDAVWTFTADKVRRFRRYAVSAAQIRNAVTVWFGLRGLSKTITQIDDSGAGNTLEISTSSAHGLVAGCRFRIYGTTSYNQSSAADGFYTVATIPTGSTLTTVETPLVTGVASETAGTITSSDHDGAPIPSSIIATDATSIATYGYMPCQLSVISATNIDTVEEAVALVTNVLSDISQPKAEIEIEVAPAPWVELGDVVYVPADGQRSDVARKFAVVGYAHDASPQGRSTTLRLRGAVAAGKVDVWMGKLAGYRGRNLARPTKTGGTPATPTVSGIIGGFSSAWTTPTPRLGAAWDKTEVHASTSSGFSPTDATLVGTVRGSQSVVANLAHGQTYYTKTVHRDRYGNRSIPSAQASALALWTARLPGFSAYLAADTALADSSTFDRLPFDTETFDVQGNHLYSAGDVFSSFTAPARGPYHFDARVEIRYSVTGTTQHDENPDIMLFKGTTSDSDGTMIARSGAVYSTNLASGSSSGPNQPMSLSATVFLEVGDVVCLKHKGRDGAKTYDVTMQGGAAVSYWSGYLVAHVPA